MSEKSAPPPLVPWNDMFSFLDLHVNIETLGIGKYHSVEVPPFKAEACYRSGMHQFDQHEPPPRQVFRSLREDDTEYVDVFRCNEWTDDWDCSSLLHGFELHSLRCKMYRFPPTEVNLLKALQALGTDATEGHLTHPPYNTEHHDVDANGLSKAVFTLPEMALVVEHVKCGDWPMAPITEELLRSYRIYKWFHSEGRHRHGPPRPVL